MRLLIGIITVLSITAMLSLAQDDAPRCENCGMFWEKSPTAVEIVVEVDGDAHTHLFECIGCMHEFVHEHYGEVMPISIKILDYNTFDTDKRVMLDAFKAYYLFGTERIKGSMPPFVAAFATEKAAKHAQQKLGGELTGFKEMRQMMIEAKGEQEGTEHE